MTLSFKTLVSPWVAIVCGGLILLNNIQRWGVYEGEFLWAVDMQAIAIFLIGPILTAATAVDSARVSQPGNRHLVLLKPRLHMQYWHIVRSALFVILAIYGVCLAALAIYTTSQAGFLSEWPTALLQIAVHCAWMFFYASLGTLIGRFVSPLLSGVLGVLFGFLILNAQASLASDSFSLMEIGGATFSRLGNIYNPAFLGAQFVIFVALGLLAILAPVRARNDYLAPKVITYGILVVTIIAIFVPLNTLPKERWLADPKPPTDCVEIGIEVCTYAEHPRFQARVLGQLNQLQAAAAEGNFEYALPSRVTQHSRSYYPDLPTDPLQLSIFHDEQSLDLQTFTSWLYHAAHCEERYSEEYSPWLDNYFQELEMFTYTVEHHATGYWESGVDPYTSAEVEGFMERYKTCDFD